MLISTKTESRKLDEWTDPHLLHFLLQTFFLELVEALRTRTVTLASNLSVWVQLSNSVCLPVFFSTDCPVAWRRLYNKNILCYKPADDHRH